MQHDAAAPAAAALAAVASRLGDKGHPVATSVNVHLGTRASLATVPSANSELTSLLSYCTMATRMGPSEAGNGRTRSLFSHAPAKSLIFTDSGVVTVYDADEAEPL